MTKSNPTDPSTPDDTPPDITLTYWLDDSQPLSDKILEAVDEHTCGSVDPEELVLYDVINPEALDILFREGADENGIVMFDFGEVRVHLWHESEHVKNLYRFEGLRLRATGVGCPRVGDPPSSDMIKSRWVVEFVWVRPPPPNVPRVQEPIS